MKALIGPHGEVAEYRGVGDYLGTPGAVIRRMAGVVTIPATNIGIEWVPVEGEVVTVARDTGRWTTPVERRLGVRLPDGSLLQAHAKRMAWEDKGESRSPIPGGYTE